MIRCTFAEYCCCGCLRNQCYICTFVAILFYLSFISFINQSFSVNRIPIKWRHCFQKTGMILYTEWKQTTLCFRHSAGITICYIFVDNTTQNIYFLYLLAWHPSTHNGILIKQNFISSLMYKVGQKNGYMVH